MHIQSIQLKNIGPVSDVRITPQFVDNSPVPIVLVGQNGAGKSLTLAVILDAVTETRREVFQSLQEVSGDDFLRLSSRNYIKNDSGYSHGKIIFGDKLGSITFNEVVSRMPYDSLIESAPELNVIPEIGSEGFKSSGFFKGVVLAENQKESVKQLNFLYFPHFRYEPAYWLSPNANVDFVSQSDIYGQARTNPIRANIIEETKRWILNVVFDREIYERKTERVSVPLRGEVAVFRGYEGPNTKLFEIIGEILTAMLKAKDPSVQSARLGIGAKRKREISVIVRRQGGVEETVAPDISQMSSGELMSLGLASEILRSYELIKGKPPNSLQEVDGLVLVDEVDLHLHISFQKTVLPIILRKFPNVQFILTTHSPFFLLGMSESGAVDIINMPIGNKIKPEDFNEFQSSYDIFIEQNAQFRDRYRQLVEASSVANVPLIITEGKTDWRHLKNAFNKLRDRGLVDNIDIQFLEFDDEVNMGDVKLSQMCEHAATVPQSRKLIFVFDRDNQKITKLVSGDPDSYKNWGNNVFSICLPVPEFRKEYKNLSIELYYRDEDISTTQNGKRLWFSNEIEIVTNPTTGEKIYRALQQPVVDDEFEKKVFDQPADKIVDKDGASVGLSKSAFAECVVLQPLSENFDLNAFKVFFNVLCFIVR